MQQLAVLFRVNVPVNCETTRLARILEASLEIDDEIAVDMIDATLEVLGPGSNHWFVLQQHLTAGASAWQVTDDRTGLTRVVADEAQATYDGATAIADEATDELREAWLNAFGRNGDPSDAWDHAIKAVEHALIREMMPSDHSATLGKVIGQLGSAQSAAQWRMILPGQDASHDVAPLVGMLRLIWPNHDRHGGTAPPRPPSEQEARAVVSLAATIVQWHREGWVVQKR